MVAQSITKQRQQRADDIGQMIERLTETNQSLLDSLESRSLAREENWGPKDDAVFERGLKEVEQNRRQIAELQAQLDADSNTPQRNEGTPMVHLANQQQQKPQTRSGDTFTTEDGRRVKALSANEKLATHDVGIGCGDYLRCLLTNRYDELPERVRQEQTSSSDSAGGYLVPDAIGQQIWDLARAGSAVLRAGCQTINMNTGELSLVRLATDPTAYWRGEGQSITASEAVFDRVVLRPRTVGVIIPASVELLEDGRNVGVALETAIRGALGAEIDRVLLTGSGSANEPLGVRNASGVNAITSVGVQTNYDPQNNGIGDIFAQNFGGDPSDLGWLIHPRDADLLTNLKTGIASDQTALTVPPRVAQLQQFQTTQIATDEGGGSDESYQVIGDFSQMILAVRSNISIRMAVDGSVTDAASNTYNMTSDLMRSFVAFARLDCAVMRPGHFTVLSGITTS